MFRFKQQRFRSDGADTTRAEEFRKGDQQVDRQEEQIAHKSNVTTSGNLRKTTLEGPIGLELTNSHPTGYKVISVSLAALRISMKGIWDFAADLRQREEQAEIDLEKTLTGHPLADVNKFAGFPKIKELESKYLPREEVRKKYDESIGYSVSR